MSNRERAAEHVTKAEELAEKALDWKKGGRVVAMGSVAAMHATLALYYQREADRANET